MILRSSAENVTLTPTHGSLPFGDVRALTFNSPPPFAGRESFFSFSCALAGNTRHKARRQDNWNKFEEFILLISVNLRFSLNPLVPAHRGTGLGILAVAAFACSLNVAATVRSRGWDIAPALGTA